MHPCGCETLYGVDADIAVFPTLVEPNVTNKPIDRRGLEEDDDAYR